ncbi:hypothetical protein JWG42_02610 [Desulfoprunum benzoelyticum]|uniref:Uncharacterized protein n=1 Tax=Desulfoprunum benzoelyticum TaxID=1506996 RepID=A0A840ULQ9_9BACT|nr:hypothetical protein [Desulfoprunum benzoelyticum]MBB5346712.1 hypothetical protein [Desulfoprunum benzoelyticum]MBM9529046.1 hypothetical protein [Desulfoprunum benzoelyticum]
MNAQSQLLISFLPLVLHIGIFVLLPLFLLMYARKGHPDPVLPGDPAKT